MEYKNTFSRWGGCSFARAPAGVNDHPSGFGCWPYCKMLSLRFPTDAKVDWREWLLAEKSLDNCQVSLKALVGWGSGKVMLASVQQPLLDLDLCRLITRCYMGAVWLID